MPYGDHDNSEDFIFDLVDNPVVAFPDPVGIPSFEFFVTVRSGIVSQFKNSGLEKGVSGAFNFGKLFLCLPFNKDLVYYFFLRLVSISLKASLAGIGFCLPRFDLS